MDGHLKITIENFKKVQIATDYFRCEAEYFNSNQTLKDIKTTGADVAICTQYGTSKFLNEEERGYPVLRLNEFDECFIKKPKKYCDSLDEIEFKSLKLRKGDVLICRTNGNPDLVGKSAVIEKDYDYAFASYLFKVEVDKTKIKPEVLVTFLNGKYGRQEIDKNSMKGNQTNFSPAKFLDIKIPVFDKDLQDKISLIISKAYDEIEKSKILYLKAEAKLDSLINLNSISDSFSIKTLKESLGTYGRLDAEYYLPKYEVLENTIKSMKFDYLKNIADIQSGEFVEENLYGKKGYSYVRGSDINGKVIDTESSVKIDINIQNMKFINFNDIAFTMIGSVGNVSINKDKECVVSNNLGAIKPKEEKYANFLLLFLSSKYGQLLFEKYQTRTAQPKIRKDDVENFLIPLFNDEILTELSTYVENSLDFRRRAKSKINLAVNAIEMAIESNDKTALLWLECKNMED